MSTKPVLFTFFMLVSLLALGALFSCDRARTEDPRGDLIRSLKGADVQDYLFSLNEEEAKTTSALTNRVVENVITLGKDDPGLVLGYTRVEDRNTNISKTYKSEITKRDGSLRLVVTDMATNAVTVDGSFPSAGPACFPAGQFVSLTACINEFNCTNNGPLQCKANRTCDPQFAALTCCLKDGSIFSVHLIIQPNNRLCQVLAPRPEGLASRLN